jgi:hypothetical protein
LISGGCLNTCTTKHINNFQDRQALRSLGTGFLNVINLGGTDVVLVAIIIIYFRVDFVAEAFEPWLPGIVS